MTAVAPSTVVGTELAGAGRRGVQFLLDYFITGIVAGLSLLLFLLLPTDDDGAVEGGSAFVAVLLAVILISVGWALWVWCWRPVRRGGQTYAMSALGVRVEKLSGEPVTFWTMFVRMLCLAIDVGITPLVGWLTIVFSQKKQRVGDMIASTVVVRTT